VNRRKADGLPHEAGLTLLSVPRAPKELPVTARLRNAHGESERHNSLSSRKVNNNMSMVPNNRFIFENRPLAEWLLQLVDQEAVKRKAAAKVVTERFYMPEEYILESGEGTDKMLADFSAAIRATIAEPGFPAVDFVRNVLALEMALHESWCEKTSADSKREQEADDAELAKLGENPTEAERRRYARRVWIRCLRDCKKISEEEPHEVMTTGMALIRVIESLGVELLPAADLLREMLFSKHKAYLASDAIARMGRPGLELYDDLLRGLKLDDANHYCARALGALLRDVPEKIPEVLQLACACSGTGQTAAIFALGHCGKRATEACPDVEWRLREILETNPEGRLWYFTVGALGECARTSKTLDALLERLEPGDVGQKGEIILALGRMGIEPERVVPTLINMLAVFEEYDPDWSYYGEHGRVVSALREFQGAAAPAVPALIHRIWRKPAEQWTSDRKLIVRADPDEEIIKLLGELGTSSRDALPVLLQVRDEMRRRNAEVNPPDGSESACYDDSDSSWSVAIRRIQGVTV
jgi:hypothetical protein